MHRVRCEGSETLGQVLPQLQTILNEHGITPRAIELGKEANGKDKTNVESLLEKTIEALGFRHGDIVYVHYQVDSSETKGLLTTTMARWQLIFQTI